MGSGPAEVVPVRIDPELKGAIEERAEADHTTTSEIIRQSAGDFDVGLVNKPSAADRVVRYQRTASMMTAG